MRREIVNQLYERFFLSDESAQPGVDNESDVDMSIATKLNGKD